MIPSHRFLPFVAVSVFVLSCATNRPFDRATEPGGRPLPATTAGSVIITGERLSADPGRPVLDAIRIAMPPVQVSGRSRLGRLPFVELRCEDRRSGRSH